MTNNKKISIGLKAKKLVSIAVMSFCLFLLTAANFIIYPASDSYCCSMTCSNDSNDEEAPSPVEEKSSSKTGLTIQEEYIHELHSIRDLSEFIVLSKHKIPDTEKLQIVHFELVSPPPKA